jgi:sugar phosphate isomerase/epimerase
MRSEITIGMNGRFFANNWRPAAQEIAFAKAAGFQAMQFAVRDEGLSPQKLGDSFAATAAQLADANLTPVMEIVVAVDATGHNPQGVTPLAILEANLPAIQALGIYAAHWHLVPLAGLTVDAIRRVEELVRPDLAAGVALANAHGFRLGIEHNEPDFHLFGTPQVCAAALDVTPGLHFVWDLNHTEPAALADFLALTPRMSMLHISDTPLPAVNHHLPVGQGTIDFTHYFTELQARGFRGPAILEIGGQPKSGGFGRDTDEALLDSRRRLMNCLPAIGN